MGREREVDDTGWGIDRERNMENKQRLWRQEEERG